MLIISFCQWPLFFIIKRLYFFLVFSNFGVREVRIINPLRLRANAPEWNERSTKRFTVVKLDKQNPIKDCRTFGGLLKSGMNRPTITTSYITRIRPSRTWTSWTLSFWCQHIKTIKGNRTFWLALHVSPRLCSREPEPLQVFLKETCNGKVPGCQKRPRPAPYLSARPRL